MCIRDSYETGYSLHTLRQASRRSWRIGQRSPVRVKFVTYSGTMQETCLRLMGKKMLVALMMEGKFSGEGLQALDTDAVSYTHLDVYKRQALWCTTTPPDRARQRVRDLKAHGTHRRIRHSRAILLNPHG